MSTELRLRDLYFRLLQSWNDRDANAMADCFAADGIMIGFDGSLVEGQEAIKDHLAPIFAEHPTAAFVTAVRTTRLVGNVGILRADAGMVPPGKSAVHAETNARQTLVAGMTDMAGEVVLFQNTPVALHWDAPGRDALAEELTAAFNKRGPFPQ